MQLVTRVTSLEDIQVDMLDLYRKI